MATLNLKTITTMVQDIAAAVQAKAKAVVDFSPGSVFLALAEAAATVGAWLQGMVLQVLAASRLSTSLGSDVDTFIADFNFARILSSAAAGNVTFGRFSPILSAIVPVGAQVQTSDGTQTFAVIADTTNAAYSASLGTTGGYFMAAGVSSVSVPVAAVTGGVAGNVQAGLVTVMLTSISGVDTVTNSAAFTGGADSEKDARVKSRFALYWLGLSRANAPGIEAAIAATNLNVQYTITENEAYDGTYAPGSFFVVVDDGTGSPSQSLLTAVTNAVWAVRGLSIMPSVHATVMNNIIASMTLVVASGYVRNDVIAAVAAQIEAKIAAIGLGGGVGFYDLSTWAKSVPGCTDVTDVLLNGASGDTASIVANPRKTPHLVSLMVN